MVILFSCFRSISAFVQVILGSGFPVTVAGSSILVPAFTVRPASSFTSRKISGASEWVKDYLRCQPVQAELKSEPDKQKQNLKINTLCVHSLDIICGFAWFASSLPVQGLNAVGIPFAFFKTCYFHSVRKQSRAFFYNAYNLFHCAVFIMFPKLTPLV